MALAVAGIVLNVAAVQTSADWLTYASFAAIMLFLLIAIGVTFHNVATDTEISANRIVGAVAVYLMLGVLWAVAYTITDFTWPGSFKGFESHAGTAWNSEWLYFSFVTMTTLGYGDITPNNEWAGTLAYAQALIGQLYVALTIARVVGLQVAKQS